MRRSIYLLPLVAAAVPLLLAACGSSAPTSTPTPTPSPSPTLEKASDTDLEAILATTVLRPGSQRVAFLLVSPKALITVPEVTVSTFYVPETGATGRPKETRTAHFNLWPYGTRGSYNTMLSFDQQGTWRLDIAVDDESGVTSRTQLLVDVQDGFGLVDINSIPPASRNKMVEDVSSLAELSSAHIADPDLYSITIADALDSGLPTLVVFSTPAFCTSATCGPQVETVQELKEQYKGRAHFIHVEVYDNPHEVLGDLSRARISPVVDEWGLSNIPHWFNESWVFIVGKDGRVSARFEAYASAFELEEALLAALE